MYRAAVNVFESVSTLGIFPIYLSIHSSLVSFCAVRFVFGIRCLPLNGFHDRISNRRTNARTRSHRTTQHTHVPIKLKKINAVPTATLHRLCSRIAYESGRQRARKFVCQKSNEKKNNNREKEEKKRRLQPQLSAPSPQNEIRNSEWMLLQVTANCNRIRWLPACPLPAIKIIWFVRPSPINISMYILWCLIKFSPSFLCVSQSRWILWICSVLEHVLSVGLALSLSLSALAAGSTYFIFYLSTRILIWFGLRWDVGCLVSVYSTAHTAQTLRPNLFDYVIYIGLRGFHVKNEDSCILMNCVRFIRTPRRTGPQAKLKSYVCQTEQFVANDANS